MEKMNLEMIRGDTLSFAFEVDFDEAPQKLEKADFSCKVNLDDDEALFHKELGSGIDFSKQDGNKMYYVVRIAPEDTENLEAGMYYYDLSIEMNGDVFTILNGSLKIESDVTTVKTYMPKYNGIKEIKKTSTNGLVDTYTITLTDGTTSTFSVANGKGISSISKTGTSELVDTYTITFNDGTTSTFTVTNGAKGDKGDKGDRGDTGWPTDAQTESAVTKWLNEHPEATTTVQDNSLTIDKMVVGTLGYVTPEMFGAIGDGVADDTGAIQNAINSGISLIVFTKKYKMNTVVSLKSNIHLYSPNYAKLILNSNGFHTAEEIENILIDGLYFYNNNIDTTATTIDSSMACVHIGKKSNNICVKNCIFEQVGYALKVDELLPDVTSISHTNIIFDNNLIISGVMPLYFGGTKDCFISNNDITVFKNVSKLAHHIYISSACKDFIINNNIFRDGYGQQINVHSDYTGAIQPSGIKVYNCKFYEFDYYCIAICSDEIVFENCEFISSRAEKGLFFTIGSPTIILKNCIIDTNSSAFGEPNEELTHYIINDCNIKTGGIAFRVGINCSYEVNNCNIEFLNTTSLRRLIVVGNSAGHKFSLTNCTVNASNGESNGIIITINKGLKLLLSNNTFYCDTVKNALINLNSDDADFIIVNNSLLGYNGLTYGSSYHSLVNEQNVVTQTSF